MTDRLSFKNETRLPLLLLPGTACDRRVFSPIISRLGDYPLLVGDLGGCRTMPELAKTILHVAPPRFLLAGFSLGGICALEIIAQAPQRVSKLALIDTTARPDPPANAAIRRKGVERARALGMETYILDSWQKLVAPANTTDVHLREEIVAMARDCGSDRLADQAEAAIYRADSRPRLAAINQPTLVLAGAHEQVCPLEAQYEMANGIAGADLRLIQNAGHFAPLEEAEAVSFHIVSWLRGEHGE